MTEFVIYKDEKYWLQSSGRYFQSGRKRSKHRLLHRRIWFDNFGEIPPFHVIHHKDHDWRNNDVSNLEMIHRSKHSSDHMKEFLKDPGYVKKMNSALDKAQELSKAWHASEDGIKWHKIHAKEGWINRKKTKIICEYCSKEHLTPFPSRTRFCSRSCSLRGIYSRQKGKEQRCLECKAVFMANKYRKVECCGHKCSAGRRARLNREANMPK